MDSKSNIITLSSNTNDLIQSDPIAPGPRNESREKQNFPDIPKLKLSKPSSPNKRYYTLLKDKRAANFKRTSQPDSSVLIASPDGKKSPSNALPPNTQPKKNKSLSISSVQKDELIVHDMSELDINNINRFSAPPKNNASESENNKKGVNSSHFSSPKKPSFTYPNTTILHYNKLKQKIGMNTHIAHPREYRDIPCSSKDIDLAIDATRVIELNRERVKRLANSLRPKSTMGARMNTKEGENFILNFDNDKFLINNPIFSTLWERIFIRKDMILTSGKQNFWNHDERDEERLQSKYAFKNGLPFFKGDAEALEKLRESTASTKNNSASLVKFLDKSDVKSLDLANIGQKEIIRTPYLGTKKETSKENQPFFDSKGLDMEKTQAETAILFSMKNKTTNTAFLKNSIGTTERERIKVKMIDESKLQYDSLLKRTMARRINYIAKQKGVEGGYGDNPLEMLSQTYML